VERLEDKEPICQVFVHHFVKGKVNGGLEEDDLTSGSFSLTARALKREREEEPLTASQL